MNLNASDVLALSMLGFIILTLLAVGSLAFVMARNVKNTRNQPDIFKGLSCDKNLKKVNINKKDEIRNSSNEWEKGSDWWKKE